MNDTIGARVRHAREQRGLSLGDAARLTKLSPSVLRAIERDDFAGLPGGMYRKAYLRTLAAEVGLDPLAIAADYEAQYEPPVEPAAPTTEAATVAGGWVVTLPPQPRTVVTLTALAILSAAWFAFRPAPVAVSAPLAGQSPTELRVRPTLDGQGTVTAPPVQGDEARVAPAMTSNDVPLKVDLTTTGWCWVAAKSDGAQVVYRLIEPGERLVVAGQRRIWLRLGDAGSVQLSVNDGPPRTPGEDGEVVELEVTPADAKTVRGGATRTES
jgi:cytoskeletal protein RodZ